MAKSMPTLFDDTQSMTFEASNENRAGVCIMFVQINKY